MHHRVTLNQLFETLVDLLSASHPGVMGRRPAYGPFRQGDVRHSLADISRARQSLGYEPTHDLRSGLAEALGWYVSQFDPAGQTVRS